MSETESETKAATEWLADCPTGYGWGRTQQDAMLNMLAHMDPLPERLGDTVEVHTVEHRGEASVGMSGWRVEEFVSGEILTIDRERLDEHRAYAMDAVFGTSDIIDDAEAEALDME